MKNHKHRLFFPIAAAFCVKNTRNPARIPALFSWKARRSGKKPGIFSIFKQALVKNTENENYSGTVLIWANKFRQGHPGWRSPAWRIILLLPSSVWKCEAIPGTATKFLSLLLSCVALGSNTQSTYKEQSLLFVRHTRGWKLESDVQKKRSIKGNTAQKRRRDTARSAIIKT